MNVHEHRADGSDRARGKLVVATVATLVFAGIEFGGGFLSNSLALVGDAFHNLTDALALVLALVAIALQRRRPTAEKSYGYQRAGVIASFVNAAVLVGFTIVIFVEAWKRYRNPEPVETGLMLAVSILALTVNAGIAWWLHDHGRADLNVRSAVLHQVADALSSLGVIIAAILIRLTGRLEFDPLLSVLIGALVLWSAWGILRESLNLLLDGTPRGIAPGEVAAALAAEDGVFGVHHLHIWALGPASPALSCHLLLGDIPLSATTAVLERVNALLLERYGIVHTTIQLEFVECVSPPCEEREEGASLNSER